MPIGTSDGEFYDTHFDMLISPNVYVSSAFGEVNQQNDYRDEQGTDPLLHSSLGANQATSVTGYRTPQTYGYFQNDPVQKGDRLDKQEYGVAKGDMLLPDKLPAPVQAGMVYTPKAPDYDYEAAKAAGVKPDANGHMPDTYKLPNHITFSNESIYHGKGGNEGGQWAKDANGKWTFTPGPTNLKNYTPQELQDYFKTYEPDATLILPEAKSQTTGNPVSDYIYKNVPGAKALVDYHEAKYGKNPQFEWPEVIGNVLMGLNLVGGGLGKPQSPYLSRIGPLAKTTIQGRLAQEETTLDGTRRTALTSVDTEPASFTGIGELANVRAGSFGGGQPGANINKPGLQVIEGSIKPPGGEATLQEPQTQKGMFTKAEEARQILARQRAAQETQRSYQTNTDVPWEDKYTERDPAFVKAQQMIEDMDRNNSLTPAVRVKGKTFTGQAHWEAFEKAQKEFGPGVEEPALQDEGFLTKSGRWLSRKEAYAFALKNDLISTGGPRVKNYLMSEDLSTPMGKQ